MQGNSKIYIIGAIVIVVAAIFFFTSGADEAVTDAGDAVSVEKPAPAN